MPSEVGYLIDIIALMLIYVFWSKSWKKHKANKKVLYTLMYIYISFVLFFTLMPIITSIPFINEHEYVPMEMTLFADYKNGINTAVLELILNVIMLIPFGVMLPLIKNKKFFCVIIQTLCFTLAIELIQPLLHANRISDITDVLTNMTGGIIGYIIYLIFKPIFKKIFSD